MKRQIKTTLLNYLKLGMLSCIALPAYANNIPENLSNWQPGASTKNGDSNATFSMAVLTEEGENYGSLFKSEQSLNVVGDIRVAPEHVGKNGKVFIVAQYNNQWFMKGANGWTPWDLQTKNLVARSAFHPLLEVESPVIENGLSNLLGDFEIFLGYLVDDDLNYNKTPLKFAVKVPEATKAADLTIKSFTASKSTLEPSDKTKLLVNIKNIGDALAPNTQLYYYKRASNSNEENSLNEGDKQECTQSLYQLPIGNSNDKYCQVDMPDTAGEYYYGVCVKTVEGETNLTNNCSSAIKITVKDPEAVTPVGLIAQAALTGLSAQTKEIGSGNFTLAAGGGSGSGAVSYSSGDTGVATVDSATGEVTLVAIGTVTITATKAADSTYSAKTASYGLTINAASGLIGQAALTGLSAQTKEIGSGNYTLAVGGGSGSGAVSYSSGDTGVATVDSATGEVTLVAVGTATITATKAADSTYSAETANYVLTINLASQAALTGLTPQTKEIGSGNFTLAAGGGSGSGAVSYSSGNTAVATVDSVTGEVTLKALGTAIITATKAADSTYAAGTANYDLTVEADSIAGVGFSYTKLVSDGTNLGDQGVAWDPAGSEGASSQWSCVRDENTGLTWEVKTAANQGDLYTWGGLTAIGTGATPEFGTYSNGTDWDSLVTTANTGTDLCGFNDDGWRLPTRSELDSITQKGVVSGSAIDTAYFPNTVVGYYWSASPHAETNTLAWLVDFSTGADAQGARADTHRVRLVHD